MDRIQPEKAKKHNRKKKPLTGIHRELGGGKEVAEGRHEKGSEIRKPWNEVYGNVL